MSAKKNDAIDLQLFEWEGVGSDLKKARKLILDIWMDERLGKNLTIEQTRGFRMIENGLSVLRSDLENVMFERLAEKGYTDKQLMEIFYGVD
jgi:hypothetical protein